MRHLALIVVIASFHIDNCEFTFCIHKFYLLLANALSLCFNMPNGVLLVIILATGCSLSISRCTFEEVSLPAKYKQADELLSRCIGSSENFFFLKMGQPRPLFRLFLVFSNKQYKFYNNSM